MVSPKEGYCGKYYGEVENRRVGQDLYWRIGESAMNLWMVCKKRMMGRRQRRTKGRKDRPPPNLTLPILEAVRLPDLDYPPATQLPPVVTVTLAMTRFVPGSADYDYDGDRRRVS